MKDTLQRDGFCVLQTQIESPFDQDGFDPKLQTDLLVCHLFVNDGRSIGAITRMGLDRQRIVGALLKHGVIQDRRYSPVRSAHEWNQVNKTNDGISRNEPRILSQ